MPYTIDPSRDVALDVDGDFTWETIRKGDEGPKFLHGHKKPGEKGKAGNGKKDSRADRKKKDAPSSVLPTTADDAEESELEEKEREKEPLEEKPFELKNLKLRVPKGSFVAIVGRVGSGKVRVLFATGRAHMLMALGRRARCCRRSSVR